MHLKSLSLSLFVTLLYLSHCPSHSLPEKRPHCLCSIISFLINFRFAPTLVYVLNFLHPLPKDPLLLSIRAWSPPTNLGKFNLSSIRGSRKGRNRTFVYTTQNCWEKNLSGKDPGHGVVHGHYSALAPLGRAGHQG